MVLHKIALLHSMVRLKITAPKIRGEISEGIIRMMLKSDGLKITAPKIRGEICRLVCKASSTSHGSLKITAPKIRGEI